MTALLADCGGTFARFALWEDGKAVAAETLAAEGHAGFAAAARDFLEAHGAPRIDAVAVGAAGPAEDNRAALTNGCRWTIGPDEIAEIAPGARGLVVNDFAPLAAALPHLTEAETRMIAGPAVNPGRALAVIGPGTGLGVAARLASGAIASGEGGHAGLSPATDREIAVLHFLQRTHGYVKAEAILSGPGLENLYATLGALDGVRVTAPPTAGEIAARARAGTDALASETLALFTGWLGAFAGDVALMFGANGGVFLAGGILPRWGALFDEALFLRRFRRKGSHSVWMQSVPVRLITAPDAVFKGLAALLEV
jgi:glucokinase